jgi:hypothetical protein
MDQPLQRCLFLKIGDPQDTRKICHAMVIVIGILSLSEKDCFETNAMQKKHADDDAPRFSHSPKFLKEFPSHYS